MAKIHENDLGQHIKQLRKKRNWTQKMLANKLFVSTNCISDYESGRTLPSINIVIALSELYKVSTDFILLGHENTSSIRINHLMKKLTILQREDMIRMLEIAADMAIRK